MKVSANGDVIGVKKSYLTKKIFILKLKLMLMLTLIWWSTESSHKYNMMFVSNLSVVIKLLWIMS